MKSVLTPLILLAWTGIYSVSASTICSGIGDCGEPPDVPDTMFLIEVLLQNPGDTLIFSTDTLIFLDTAVYSNLTKLSIHADTEIFHGLAELPDSTQLPARFDYGSIGLAGNAVLDGINSDYFLLRNFSDPQELTISSSAGIVILDSGLIAPTVVPLPPAICLLAIAIAPICMSRRASRQ